jgi:hypothetical protein
MCLDHVRENIRMQGTKKRKHEVRLHAYLPPKISIEYAIP